MEYKLEFFKEQYDKQIEVKEALGNRFALITTIVPLLFGGIFFCISNINDLENHPLSFWFLIGLGAISLILDIIIVVLLVGYFKGENYLYLQQPRVWYDIYEQCKTYTNNQPNPDVEEDFKNYLTEEYAKFSEYNWHVNNVRRNRLNLTHKFIIASIFSTLIACTCYFPSFFYDDANTQKVEITKHPTIKIQEVQNVNKSGKQSTTTKSESRNGSTKANNNSTTHQTN
ncbi:hypothetical protein QFZ31_005748 [Neobacillus niacini]|uniref:DUF308 domain-containing protein n=1 Tax=Neobacillus driksii TaxID=3035913 RepID=UPI0027820893|nr:DUF308 domain-containing protein [Neobacillus niacini]MDQ0975870.1 hypothetical protein [Neobacillus niacini]